MEEIIKIEGLTKEYKNSRGIFDVSFSINEGEVFGYLGPNGAGKSTTIRCMMGFIKAQTGTAQINGKDIWKESKLIQQDLGYVSGEVELPKNYNALKFIKYIFKLRKLTDWKYVEDLINYWEFNPNLKFKKMSKGMKQKVGLVLAFMHKPKFLILDEPTTGLDPLMQEKFVKLVKQRQSEGSTILMSSHIFQEIEKTCERVAIIRAGKIVSVVDLREMEESNNVKYKVTFAEPWVDTEEEFKIIDKSNDLKQIIFEVERDKIKDFLSNIKKGELLGLEEIKFSLNDYFMDFYGEEMGGKI